MHTSISTKDDTQAIIKLGCRIRFRVFRPRELQLELELGFGVMVARVGWIMLRVYFDWFSDTMNTDRPTFWCYHKIGFP